jgi:hypothetical protein
MQWNVQGGKQENWEGGEHIPGSRGGRGQQRGRRRGRGGAESEWVGALGGVGPPHGRSSSAFDAARVRRKEDSTRCLFSPAPALEKRGIGGRRHNTRAGKGIQDLFHFRASRDREGFCFFSQSLALFFGKISSVPLKDPHFRKIPH